MKVFLPSHLSSRATIYRGLALERFEGNDATRADSSLAMSHESVSSSETLSTTAPPKREVSMCSKITPGAA